MRMFRRMSALVFGLLVFAGVALGGSSQSGATAPEVEFALLATSQATELAGENESLSVQVAELEARLIETEAALTEAEARVDAQIVRIGRGVDWRENVQSRLWATQRELRSVREDGTDLASLDIDWIRAYVENGGDHLTEMLDVILPCESGGAAGSPHDAISPSRDYGRAQINRAVWRSEFEELTGEPFETGVLDPELNGMFAAHVENVQGLGAWECWNRR